MTLGTRKGKIVMIPVDKIHVPNPRVRNKKQYAAIAENVVQVGLKRPITVTSCKSNITGKDYDLVCSQGRLEIFQACEQTEIPAIVIDASEEEMMVMSIVENMARRQHSPTDLLNGIELLRKQGYEIGDIAKKTGMAWAYERGVSEAKIASALNVDVKSIILKRKMLDGICKEAIELLKDKMVSGGVFRVLKKMVPMRQIECAELMNSMNVYSVPYAKALLAGTPKDKLTEPDKPKKIKGIDEEQMARMQAEMLSLQDEYRLIEETLGTNVLNFTVAKGYIAKLMDNAKVLKYLGQNHPEIFDEFQKISDLKTLNQQEKAEALG